MVAAERSDLLVLGEREGGLVMKLVFDNEDFDGQFLRASRYAVPVSASVSRRHITLGHRPHRRPYLANELGRDHG